MIFVETGINKSDLVVLEGHIVYSLNKPKAAARLYVMQCTQSINDDIRVPIKDLIERLVHSPTFSIFLNTV